MICVTVKCHPNKVVSVPGTFPVGGILCRAMFPIMDWQLSTPGTHWAADRVPLRSCCVHMLALKGCLASSAICPLARPSFLLDGSDIRVSGFPILPPHSKGCCCCLMASDWCTCVTVCVRSGSSCNFSNNAALRMLMTIWSLMISSCKSLCSASP